MKRHIIWWTVMGGIFIGAGLRAQETNLPPPPPAETNATAVEEAAPPAVPQDPAKNIVARFSFDAGTQPDFALKTVMSLNFQRASAATVEGNAVGNNQPRMVRGKFGNGILLENGFANFFSSSQAGMEKDLQGFAALTNAALSVVTDQHWEGQQALCVKLPGAAAEEGFAVEADVDKAFYNGKFIVPAYYVASVYVKGEGNCKLYLQNAETKTNGEPVYINLTPEWKRHACTFAFNYPQQNIGVNHASDWKTLLPKDQPLMAKLRLICDSIDPQKGTIYADGFQLEARDVLFAANSPGVSPHTWISGGTEVAPEKISFDITEAAFMPWKKTGSICFWFKPGWEATDGTHETLVNLTPKVLILEHGTAKLRFYPAGTEFVPSEWKDQWHHIALTWTQAGNRMLYVDGLEYPNTQNEQYLVTNATVFTTCSLDANTAPNGILDELTLYQIALTADQVKTMMAAAEPSKSAATAQTPAAETPAAEPPRATKASTQPENESETNAPELKKTGDQPENAKPAESNQAVPAVTSTTTATPAEDSASATKPGVNKPAESNAAAGEVKNESKSSGEVKSAADEPDESQMPEDTP